jgi:hypothetical protein
MHKPTYLGEARIGDRIRFELPADLRGGSTVHEGKIWYYQRRSHAVGTPVITFRISGADTARVFTCRPDLHVE